ncbi:coiled-coil domain-containing protein 40-like isoform X2 [Pomacea canaliculata]|uniref:coiled-coil domain-containing protein 40-like isoform X2 n=1 Tax=Pomacea canaliculata TaxID=400727 RepID=UPI000D7322C9|nr:coiled-coil domain-containing protein 40-like isoform X2 [Pomacea canaliculata]
MADDTAKEDFPQDDLETKEAENNEFEVDTEEENKDVDMDLTRPDSEKGHSASPTSSRQGSDSGRDFHPSVEVIENGAGATQREEAVEQDKGGTQTPAEEEEPDLPMMPAAAAELQHGGGRGGGGGGGGDSDDEDESEDEEASESEEEGEEESEGSSTETELIVLDPDHPLMKRFQAALKAHLDKQSERLTLQLRELDESLRVRKKEREDLGVDLYGVQQELARYQMMLERNHDEFSQKNQLRQRHEQELVDVRHVYKDTQLTVNMEKKKGAELQGEVENLALRLFYMENAKDDVRSDIAVMRRAAEKAEGDVAKAEAAKQRQDLFVDRLVEQVDKLREEVAMYEAQITAQTEETRAAKDALMEANMEMEAIGVEKKQLFQQWNSSLIGMRRRDEAHAAMQEALDKQEQKILSLEMEMEGYQRSIQKEQETNEKLTLILAKTEREIEAVKKQLAQCHSRFDALKAEYTVYTRMLHETEQSLNRANADKTLREHELDALRKQTEREFQAKVSLEDQIMERLRTQLTLDKAAQYSKKLTFQTRERTKNVEIEVAEIENEIARSNLETVNIKTRVELLLKIQENLDKEMVVKNDIITKSMLDTEKRNTLIERKQSLIDQYNKKLESMINAAGGVELGPMEIQINALTKMLEQRRHEISEQQQQWLRQQGALVQMTKDREAQSSAVEKLSSQLTIMSQKKIRTQNEIDQQHREMEDIERHIRDMENDIVKLNALLYKQTSTGMFLEQTNILSENDFVKGLREAEQDSIRLTDQLESVKEEKERLLNSLVEAERQIMLWEKKTQLMRETKAAIDTEVGQGEMKAMKSEIHRMTLRYSQLLKMQEKMIQDMEKSVSRRDTIVTRGEAQSKLQKKILTKGSFERQMAELRKKIKTTIQDANDCDTEIRQLREHQMELGKHLEEKQVNCQTLQSSAETLDGDVQQMLELRQKNLMDLLTKQQRMKYLQQVKEGRYTPICRTESAMQIEQGKQEGRLHALNAIVDRLNQEFPYAQLSLRLATWALSSRIVAGEEST